MTKPRFDLSDLVCPASFVQFKCVLRDNPSAFEVILKGQSEAGDSIRYLTQIGRSFQTRALGARVMIQVGSL